MTAIIFGSHGQDGIYLSALLESSNIKVVGISRDGPVLNTGLFDFNWVRHLIQEHQPEFVFHFAAISSTSHSALLENNAVISTGAINILEAVRQSSPHTKVFISGSGLQFKNDNRPIDEFCEFEARDAYSVSRIHSVYAARYFRTLGLKVYVGYFFNHESPLRTERHVSKMIANAVKRIKRGELNKIEIGDLSVIKEWSFAGDIVEAVWLFVQQDSIFETVLGSGKGHSIKEYLESCFALVNMDWKKFVKQREGFQAEYKMLVSNPASIKSLGWQPRTDFDELVKIMVGE